MTMLFVSHSITDDPVAFDGGSRIFLVQATLGHECLATTSIYTYARQDRTGAQPAVSESGWLTAADLMTRRRQTALKL